MGPPTSTTLKVKVIPMAQVFKPERGLPFPEANIWDVPPLREKNHLQQNYQNRGLGVEGAPLTAPVSTFGINKDSQAFGTPLPPPYDAPDWSRCEDGPRRWGAANYCSTNIVSKIVPSCTPGDAKASAPLCYSGLVPTQVGCVRHIDRSYAQWQCLPPRLANLDRMDTRGLAL